MPEFLIGASIWTLLGIPAIAILLIWGGFRLYRAWRHRRAIQRRLAEIAATEPRPGYGWNDIQRYRKD